MKITKEGFAIIESDQCICKWIESEGRLDHDQNMLPLVLPYIKAGDTLLDVGAFVGDHTIAYSNAVGEAGMVIAFEPNPQAFECLTYNLKDRKNTVLRNEGLSDSSGKLLLVENFENMGMAFIEKKVGNTSCISIDSLKLKRCDFIKIDVEGFEYSVLKGAEKTIKKFMPVMLIEINVSALDRVGLTGTDIYQYLDDLGYSYKNIYEGQTLYEPQLDLICTKKITL